MDSKGSGVSKCPLLPPKHGNRLFQKKGNIKPNSKNHLRPIHKRLHEQLNRRIPNGTAMISFDAVRHIWRRHGCYQNAKLEQTRKKNKGKMPSYFRNRRKLIYAIAMTILKPNWTRTADHINGRGKGTWRITRPKLGVPLYKRNIGIQRAHPTRRLYFKLFGNYIGYSGQGYGKRNVGALADNAECYCCCVVLDGKNLITGFPILTSEAEHRGIDVKDSIDESVDESTFDSSGSGSSSSSEDAGASNFDTAFGATSQEDNAVENDKARK